MKRNTLFNLLMALGLVLALGGGIVMARRAQAQGPGPEGPVLSGAEGPSSIQAAVGTAFTYQGRLEDASGPVNGTCDFQFNLYDDAWLSPSLVAGPVDRGAVTVSDGYFSTGIDFGDSAFTGEGRQLEILVYMWTVTGVHTASVTVTNCGGSANADRPITLNAQGTCTYPITSVAIGGPTTGDKDTDYVFTATVQPPNATPPIDYAWSSAGLVSGQGSANAIYRWSQSGEYQITISAGNCGGSKNDSHTIEIGIKYVYLPLVVRNH